MYRENRDERLPSTQLVTCLVLAEYDDDKAARTWRLQRLFLRLQSLNRDYLERQTIGCRSFIFVSCALTCALRTLDF